MSITPIDQQVAARLHLVQVESVISADKISSRLGQPFSLAEKMLLDLVMSEASQSEKFAGFESIVLKAILVAKGQVRSDLQRFAQVSHERITKAMVRSIPLNWLMAKITADQIRGFEAIRHPLPPMFLNFKDGMMTIDPQDITEDQPGDPFIFSQPIEPLLRPKLTKKKKQELAENLIFPPPSLREIAEILARGDWESRLDSLSRLISDKRALMSELITGYADGEGIRQLKKRVEPIVGGIKASAQRIARTEAMRVAENMQRRSWEPLGDMVIGVQILAVLDERTRPEHATRNGTIYYKNPGPGQKPISELPNLPDAPNCRCMSVPVLSMPDEIKNDPTLSAALASPSPPGLPDPTTYDQWFQKTDDGRRKMVVGAQRLETVKDRLKEEGSKRTPTWSDFIDEEGNLLDVEFLLAESPLDRQARRQRIAEIFSQRRELIRQISAVGSAE